MSRPVITLSTDFGTSDHYVGTMKGVILSIAPTAQIVDISHDIPAYNLQEGAFIIAQAYRYFPKKTIHVVVVDPGVGSARRAILLHAAGQYFVGPDNGVFSFIYAKEEKHWVREITADEYFLKPVSQTFHGRDVFAPMGAHLAMKASPASVGKKIDNYFRANFGAVMRTGKRVWTGTIIRIDHFGNVVTNLTQAEFPDLATRPFDMQVGIQHVNRMAHNYAESTLDSGVFAIYGSSGYVEISANQRSAAKILGVGSGAPVELTIY